MYSRSLMKLIDEALIPAILIIIAEIVGIAVVNKLYDLSWNFQGSGISYKTAEEFLLANSFASLVVYGVIIIGFTWVIIRSHLTHSTHIHPKLHAALSKLNFTHIVEDTFQIYHEAIVWLSYLWLFTMWFGIQWYVQLIRAGVFFSALILSAIATWLFIIDVEKEFGSMAQKRKSA